jgi:hypothetical protein
MAIVIFVFLIVCFIVWWRTAPYRKYGGAKRSLQDAKVNKATREVESETNEMEDDYVKSTTEQED